MAVNCTAYPASPALTATDSKRSMRRLMRNGPLSPRMPGLPSADALGPPRVINIWAISPPWPTSYADSHLSLPATPSAACNVHAIETKATLARYRYLIRTYLAITPYTNGGSRVVMEAVAQAALTMSDPANLINVAIEHLIQQRCELPAFSTLDRLIGHLRARVHQTLYTQITDALPLPHQVRLDTLLQVHDGLSEFTRMKAPPRQATLAHLRQWLDRLTWLESILAAQPSLAGIAHTKIRQFAAEAAALDVGDMRDIQSPRRWSLLLCFLAQSQVQTRDQLVEMFLKRMQRMTTAAHEHLHELQEQHRELEEQMMAAEVLDEAVQTPEDASGGAGRQADIGHAWGAATPARYGQVAAYRHGNYAPAVALLRPYRAALFRLYLIVFRCATQIVLIAALHYIQRYQQTTGRSPGVPRRQRPLAGPDQNSPQDDAHARPPPWRSVSSITSTMACGGDVYVRVGGLRRLPPATPALVRLCAAPAGLLSGGAAPCHRRGVRHPAPSASTHGCAAGRYHLPHAGHAHH